MSVIHNSECNWWSASQTPSIKNLFTLSRDFLCLVSCHCDYFSNSDEKTTGFNNYSRDIMPLLGTRFSCHKKMRVIQRRVRLITTRATNSRLKISSLVAVTAMTGGGVDLETWTVAVI